jgi:PKD repeat protein
MQRLSAPRRGKRAAQTPRRSFLFATLSAKALAAGALVVLLVSSTGTAAGLPSKPAMSIEGRLQAFVEDDFTSRASRTAYRLATDEGEIFTLEFRNAPRAADLRPGSRIRVDGVAENGRLFVDQVERVASPQPLEKQLAASSYTTGPKKVLLIRFNFLDDTSQPYSDATATNVLFGASGSVAAFYKEVSFGLTTQTGAITPWVTVAMNKPTTCDPFTPANMADALAKSHGFDPATYDFPVYVFPHIPCGWAGLAFVGAPGAYINQALSTYVVGHEVGHNYGLEHAHSLRCGSVSIAATPPCVQSEYGDPFDIMGSGTRHFNAFQKDQLQWLPGTGDEATFASGSANFTINPIESAAGLRAVQIPTSVNRTYWIEYRQQASGFDAGLPANVTGGALIHIGPSVDYGTDLLDMTPATNTFSDAALDVGQTFIDPDANLEISTVSQSGQTLTVHVQFGIAPPTAAFAFNPAAPTASHAVSFQDQSTGLPSSWLWTFGDGASSTVQSPAHSYAAAGSYTATLKASNGSGSSTPVSQSVVVAADPTLAFYTLSPCRIVDTRNATGPLGGPALSAGLTRLFTLAGHCGIPPTAKALSANVTVTGATGAGDLRIYASGTTDLRVSRINFKNGQTRANNAVLELGASGNVSVVCQIPSGKVQVILDVNGYYQ